MKLTAVANISDHGTNVQVAQKTTVVNAAGRGLRQQNGSARQGDLCQGQNGQRQLALPSHFATVKNMNTQLREKAIL